MDIDTATTGTTGTQRHFARLCSILSDPTADMDTICLTLRRGVPDELRMDYWRLVLGVVPLGDASKRDAALAQHVKSYQQLLTLTCSDVRDGGEPTPGADPFPIDADVPRTMPTLHFFASPSHAGGASGGGGAGQQTSRLANSTSSPAVQCPEPAFPRAADGADAAAVTDVAAAVASSSPSSVTVVADATASSLSATGTIATNKSRAACSRDDTEPGYTQTQLALRRVLFLFSRVHRGRGYAQGMNEMVGMLLWAGSNGNASHVPEIEADVFFAFQSLMQWCGEHFCAIPDHAGESGLGNTLKTFSFLLKMCDPEMHDFLEGRHQICAEFYAFRWISILFVLEFPVADVLSLWDFLLSFSDRVSIAAMFVAVSMLVNVRDRLLTLDMSSCIELLQSYPPVDINDIIATANALIDRHTVTPHLWTFVAQQAASGGGSGGGGGGVGSAVAGSDDDDDSVRVKVDKALSWFSGKASAFVDRIKNASISSTPASPKSSSLV